MPNSASDVMRRREKANAFCEAIRALDATGLLFFFWFFFWEDQRLYSSYILYLVPFEIYCHHELQLKVDCT